MNCHEAPHRWQLLASCATRPPCAPIPLSLYHGLVLALLAASPLRTTPALATCGPSDTIYVNNTRTKPGGEQGGCNPDSAFRTITGALASFTGGTGRVIAVMGTGVPYREEVSVSASDSGSASAPLRIVARGVVTLEGGDIPPDDAPLPEGNRWVPRYAAANSTLKLWAAYDSSGSKTCSQALIWSEGLQRHRRYPNAGDTLLTLIALGTMMADTAVDSVYVHAEDPNHNYSQDAGYISTRRCLLVRASNVLIDGFTMRRSRDDGIALSADTLRNVHIVNCLVMESTNSGIDIGNAVRCTLTSNVSAFNSDHGIYLKSGDPADPVEDCFVIGNTSYSNDDDTKERGGINGIRIGSGGTPDSLELPTTGHHRIFNNRVYRNEDSGIEINGSYEDTLRYNQSWENGDHGFDHLKARAIIHVGELAFGNGRTGISVEQNALRVEVRNSILMDNGRAANRHDYELEVIRAARDSFVGDYNLLYRPVRPESSGCTHGEEADSILISWRHKDLQDHAACTQRCADADSCFGTVARFATAPVNPTEDEKHSKGTEAKFMQAAAGDFRLKTSSGALDAADTTAVGWKATDVLGFKRYESLIVPNTGKPAGTFADIGPYEHDDGAPTIQVENVGCSGLKVKWIARGASADSLPVPDKYEVFRDDVEVKEDTSPQNPGNWESETFTGLTQGTVYEFYVLTTDDDGEIAKSNIAYGTPCCSPPCEGERLGGGSQAFSAIQEDQDFPLMLAPILPTPSRGTTSVSWSVSRAHAGAHFDLSLFDVAGRRVQSLAEGKATPGRFTQELGFRAQNGMPLANGVFFLRLRVGPVVLHRTIVLAR